MVQPGRPHMTIRRMRIVWWIHKTTNTHSEYLIIIAFPQEQCLYERASLLRHTFIRSVVLLSLYPPFLVLAFLIGNSGRSSVSNTIISASDVEINRSVFLYTPHLGGRWKFAVTMLQRLYPRPVFINRLAAARCRAARGSTGICRFSFLRIFHE